MKDGAPMSERINNLFTRIYKRYDFMNHLFSLGTDKLWRRRAEILVLSDPGCAEIIDIGAGTGDLSIG
ncbi:ubiquinone/menaquinone biosynthesis methyltransferase, partial [mine drainage metagenome]